MDAQQVAEELIAAWPPGTEQVIDWTDDPGAIVEGLANALTDATVTPIETLTAELSPLTATERGTGDWERNLGLDRTELAALGTLEQRRQQVWARLREQGPPTLELIRAVLAPIAGEGYGEVLIVETDRAALRTLHTRTWSGGEAIGGGDFARVKFDVRDDSLTSKAGAQLDLTFESGVDLAQLQVELEAPDGRTIVWGPPTARVIGRGSRTTVRLYAPEFYGSEILGDWIAIVDLNTGTNVLVGASLFCEGLGRDLRGNNGLGAEKFRWSVVLDSARLPADRILLFGELYRATLAALGRLTYARAHVDVVAWPGGVLAPPADYYAIVDDPFCLPDMAIVGE